MTLQAELRSGLDNCDTDSNGLELGGIVLAMREAANRIDALEASLRDVIGMLDDPTGVEHVRDMRGATVIARAALKPHPTEGARAITIGSWGVSQDERDAVTLLSTLVRDTQKWDADDRIKKRAARAADWLNRYNAKHPSRMLRDTAALSDLTDN